MKCHLLFFALFQLSSSLLLFSQSATVTGVVLDENLHPLPDVNIRSGPKGTTTDSLGFYQLHVVADVENTLTFTYLGFEKVVLKRLILTTNETFEFSPVLKTGVMQMDEVEVNANGTRVAEGITTVTPEIVRKIPGANAGVENVLRLLPGVSSNNELSTQYGVRGGNYDENLVYINGIEVHKPFLICSGQQEGLSMVNSATVEQLQFSAGGFQARYGDKLSSVLDIRYKQPAENALNLEASLLGGSATLETRSGNKKFSSLTGFRYRDNSLFVNSQQTRTNVIPAFTDLQTYLSYQFSPAFHLDFLGYLSRNRYRNQPLTRQTNFGTLDAPRALLVYYQGREDNTFSNTTAAVKAAYKPNEHLVLQLIPSLYHAAEQELADVIAQYELGEVDTDLGGGTVGETNASRGIGAEYDRRRNILDALLFSLSHKGSYTRGSTALQWGVNFQFEDLRDQVREAQFIDSAGYLLRPPGFPAPGNLPDESYTVPLLPYRGVSVMNFIENRRISGYLQYSWQDQRESAVIYYNAGLRMQHWKTQVTGIESEGQTIISPRVQVAVKPRWEKDMVLRGAIGLYQQPPFYRALRDSTGIIHPEVKAQRSYHFVIGSEYSFNLWQRPFMLSAEAYYKYMDRVNPYTLEDVRIRYAATNNATAYAEGVDLRLFGAFVPGLQSWVSLGYLRTMENIDGRGYISRPTDQRLKVGILFQDYMPAMPQVRMYLNLVYQTGVPGGSPAYANPYDFQNRLRDYRRADLGISHIFVDTNNQYPEDHWLHSFKEFYAGIEIFNLFNNQNSITNTWVRDADSKQQYAVPNYLTSRVLNVKVGMRL